MIPLLRARCFLRWAAQQPKSVPSPRRYTDFHAISDSCRLRVDVNFFNKQPVPRRPSVRPVCLSACWFVHSFVRWSVGRAGSICVIGWPITDEKHVGTLLRGA